MKYILPFALLLFALIACEEVGPDINPPSVDTEMPTDSTETVVQRILIEEFTGVQCVNCPDGARAIENFIDTYGEQVVAVSIHAGFFADPLPESQLDLSTDEGEQLEALLGPVLGYPSAAINRKTFGGSSKIHTASTWAGRLAVELQAIPQFDVDISNSYDNTSRNLSVDVEVSFLTFFTEDVRLSVLITENDIVDAQKDQVGLVEDYTHKHVFRTMLTDLEGMPLAAQNIGQSTNETFNFTLPTEWNANKCKVVAFVHLNPPGLEVLQVDEEGLSL